MHLITLLKTYLEQPIASCKGDGFRELSFEEVIV